MPNASGAAFIREQAPASLEGMTVVEVGSRLSGSHDVRELLTVRHPAAYVGIDVDPGPGVDVIGTAERVNDLVGNQVADVLIAAELMEHVRDWRSALLGMKRALKAGGVLLITTRSPGYPFHVSPFDFWRYTSDDMRAVSTDLVDVVVQSDPEAPGVFLAARRPEQFSALDLTGYRLTSILTGRRESDARDIWIWRKQLSSPRRVVSFVLPARLKRWIWRRMPPAVSMYVRRRRRRS